MDRSKLTDSERVDLILNDLAFKIAEGHEHLLPWFTRFEEHKRALAETEGGLDRVRALCEAIRSDGQRAIRARASARNSSPPPSP